MFPTAIRVADGIRAAWREEYGKEIPLTELEVRFLANASMVETQKMFMETLDRLKNS